MVNIHSFVLYINVIDTVEEPFPLKNAERKLRSTCFLPDDNFCRTVFCLQRNVGGTRYKFHGWTTLIGKTGNF